MRHPEDELRAHAHALRLLACALVGAQDADDLTQDAALHALARPPEGEGSWFGWLAAVVRHRAWKHRRAEHRRRQRETEPRGRRAAPDPLDAATHHETVARLDRALLALPEPYRRTVLQRYYEGLSPTAIAARSGEPLATIKSRLQRALAQLRERLDGEAPPSDWRAGFGAAFGLARFRSPITAGGVFVLMGTMGKLLAAAAFVGIAALLWWPADATLPPAKAAPPDREVSVPAHGTDGGRDAIAANQHQRIDPGIAPIGGAAGQATVLVGRCLDETGAPLAAVAIECAVRELTADETIEAVHTTSAADGTFRATVTAGAARRAHVELTSAGRCKVWGDWGLVESTPLVDLGDLTLPDERLVHGLVVDAAGAPQVGVRMTWSVVPREARQGSLSAWFAQDDTAISGDDGTFAFATRLPPCRVSLSSCNRKLLHCDPGLPLDLVAERELCVRLVAAPAPPPCRGIVLDASDRPIADAHVQLDGNEARTGADGRFEVAFDPNRPARQRDVSAYKDGYRQREHPQWNVEDPAEVRLVLHPDPALTIRVIDARDHRPVTRFAVTVAPERSWLSGSMRALPMADHADGRARAPAPPEPRLVTVTAADPELAPSPLLRVAPTAQDAEPDEILVVLGPWQQRRLVLTDGEAPVAAARIELLDPAGAHVERETVTLHFENAGIAGPPLARILTVGTTAADGTLALRGPTGDLALRITGPHLAPQLVQPVRLDVSGDLVVHARRAARWRGQLVPLDVARSLFEVGRRVRDGSPHCFGIELVSIDDGHALHQMLEPLPPFAADGSFDLDGIPPGNWRVVVNCGVRFAAANIAVAAGQVLHQDLDVSALAPATVTLHVVIDGRPAGNCYVNAIGEHAVDLAGRPFTSQTMRSADATGSVTIDTFVGKLQCHLSWRDPGTGRGLSLRARAAVPTAGPQEITLDLHLGTLLLRVLQPDGQPAPHVAMREGGFLGGWTGETDGDGMVRVPDFVAGTYRLEALPPRLAAPKARTEFARSFGNAALESAWIPLAAVQVVSGEANTPQQLMLPRAWEH